MNVLEVSKLKVVIHQNDLVGMSHSVINEQ